MKKGAFCGPRVFVTASVLAHRSPVLAAGKTHDMARHGCLSRS